MGNSSSKNGNQASEWTHPELKDIIIQKQLESLSPSNTASKIQPPISDLYTNKGKKYLIVIRHGERFDETYEEGDLPEEEYYDSSITEKGKVNSASTGYHLMKLFDEKGVLFSPFKVKFISSLFYRCIQTTESIRKGMQKYLDKNHMNTPDYTHTLDLYTQRKTHIEDGCSEKIRGVTMGEISKLRIYKNEKGILDSFPSIKPTLRSIFDYKNEHKDLSLNIEFSNSHHVLEACYKFYKKIIKRLHYDTTHDRYVVVAHGMYIKTLLMYLNEEGLARNTVKYNSCVILEFDFHKHPLSDGLPIYNMLVGNKIIHRPL